MSEEISYDDDFEFLMMQAFRYAIGRRSYIVGSTSSYLSMYAYNLSEEHLKEIISKIDEFDREGYLGDEYDAKEWFKLYYKCNEVLAYRDTSKQLKSITLNGDYDLIIGSALRHGISSTSHGRKIAKLIPKYAELTVYDKAIYCMITDIAESYRGDRTPVIPINDVNGYAYQELLKTLMKMFEKREADPLMFYFTCEQKEKIENALAIDYSDMA